MTMGGPWTQERFFRMELHARLVESRKEEILMIRMAVVSAILLAGCAALQQGEIVTEAPELVRMAPLPATNSPLPLGGFRLYVLLHVLADGTVGEARLLDSSGITEWDSLAIQSIKEWRFTPARRNGLPVDLWIRQPVIVQPQEPTIWVLGELVLTAREKADSLYALLQNGGDFDSLAKQWSEAPSRDRGGYLGRVDIGIYPLHVRDELRRLHEDESSRPIRVGDKYIIFKKFRKEY
jgi:TonB family protein